MVHASSASTSAEPDRRDPDVTDESDVVAAATELAEPRGASILRPDLRHRSGRITCVGHLRARLDHRRRQGRRGRGVELRTHRGHVEIDVRDGVVAKTIVFRFNPFAGTDDPELLRTPGREHDGPPRRPARLRGVRDRLGGLHQHDRARERIRGAEAPGVVMASDDHELLRRDGASQNPEHVGRGHDQTFLLDLELQTKLVASESVGHVEPPRPIIEARLLHRSAGHPRHDSRRGGVTDRLDWNPRKCDVRGIEPLHIASGRDEGRQGIPLVRQRHDRPTLDAGVVGPATVRPDRSPILTVVPRVEEDHHARGTRLLGEAHLETSVVPTVASQDDLPGAVDAELA